MKFVLDFRDPMATVIGIGGGKGANLAILTQRGFEVPHGFIVTALAYLEFFRNSGSLLDEASRRPPSLPGQSSPETAMLRERLREAPLPPDVDSQVREQLQAFPRGTAFSVRSSSTLEDLDCAAFAGQHETYLNCVGEETILRRIRDCFASLWQDRAVLYREQRGLGHRGVSMAVVIQCMVDAEVAGVSFSINPVSGALDEILVNANFGLGESVVGGEVDVDQFALSKRDGALRSRHIGAKSHGVVCSGEGTARQEIDPGRTSEQCLSEAQLRELTDLTCRVEASYQFPQDIEWAFSGGRLFVLQSRPVTVIPPRWTRDESAERFPNVITPLIWDFVEEGFHRSLNHSFRLMGCPSFSGKWFSMQGHYIYGNQNAVEIYGGRLPLSIGSLEDLESQLPGLSQRFAWVQELPLEWSRDLDHYLLRIGEFMAEPMDSKDLGEVWTFVKEVNALGSEYFLPNIAISLTQRLLYRVLHGVLKIVLRSEEGAARAFDALMAWCDTKTALINGEMHQLVEMLREDEALDAVLTGLPSREIIAGELLGPHPKFHARFTKFLRDHGHRETDFDAYHPTWVEAPWVVLDQLRLMASLPQGPSPRERQMEVKIRMQEAEYMMLSRLPQPLHFFFNELLRLARTYTSLDDVEHYQTTRLTLPMRKGLKELGHRLVRRGILAEPMDVFFTRLRDLDTAVTANSNELWDELSRAVRQEKADYLRHRAQPPALVIGEPVPVADREGGLKGMPGSPGIAEGEVYCVLSPEDFSNFPRGAVLVARTTSPAWTPLFYSACALVTESGGPLSHGAVTARELQIPAVMAIHGATTKFQNGQRLRVDGTRGEVSLSERPKGEGDRETD